MIEGVWMKSRHKAVFRGRRSKCSRYKHGKVADALGGSGPFQHRPTANHRRNGKCDRIDDATECSSGIRKRCFYRWARSKDHEGHSPPRPPAKGGYPIGNTSARLTCPSAKLVSIDETLSSRVSLSFRKRS